MNCIRCYLNSVKEPDMEKADFIWEGQSLCRAHVDIIKRDTLLIDNL